MIRLAVLLSALALPAMASEADDRATRASACYTIISPDARATCLAKAHGDSGRCYSILNADKRAECLAETRK